MKYLRTIKYTKHIILILCLSLVIGLLSGCVGSFGEENKKNAQLSIVTTIFAAYDFAKSVAGDVADITLLLKPGEEMHSFEPTPQEIIAIQECDLFIYTGGENDTWVDSLLGSIDQDKVHVLRMLDLVTLYEEEDTLDNSAEIHEHEEEEAEWDEHVWTDPNNAMIISAKIASICEDILTGKGFGEEANTVQLANASYQKELIALDAAFREVIDRATRKVIVVADRFPLRYFVEAYDLDYLALFPGCSGETEASAQAMATLIDYVKDNAIPVVFKIELTNENMLNTVAEATGCQKAIFYSCHNISLDDFNNGETYLSLMYKNVEALKEAL